MTRTFAITFDYLCPFARNANEHVVTALEHGADWDVTFLPYSLRQGNVEEGETPVWERENPRAEAGVLALQVGLAVRESDPGRFPAVHRELFAARHDRGEDIKDHDVLAKALAAGGADSDAVLAAVDGGDCLALLREEHERAVEEHGVWGVPTFVAGDRAVFVRVLDRPEGRADVARGRIEGILDLVEQQPCLHEFKQVDLPF